IHLLGGLSCPLGHIFPEGHRADSRIIPQKSISVAGKDEGYTCLRISVSQFQGTAFYIQIRLLVLSHSVKLLPFYRLKPDSQTVIICTLSGLKGPGNDLKSAIKLFPAFFFRTPDPFIFLQKQLSVLI